MLSSLRPSSQCVCVVWFALFFASSTALYTSQLPNRSNETDIPTENPDSDVPYLGKIKLGLAAALFLLVLAACGLPVIIIDCLQRDGSIHSHTSSEPNEVNCRHNLTNSNRYDAVSMQIDEQVSSTNHSRKRTDAWPLEHQNSLSPEPMSPSCMSPNSAVSEHTDLLTGEPLVHAGNGRSNHLDRSTAPPKTRMRRFTRTFFARSSAERKLLLRLWFSRCNCFAAGIFLSSGFMELYVDVEESIEKAKSLLHLTSEFQFTPFLTLIGFFLVLSIEQIVLTLKTPKVDQRISADTRLRRLSSLSDSTPCETPVSPSGGVAQHIEHTRFSFRESVPIVSPSLHPPHPHATVCVHNHGQTHSSSPHSHGVPQLNSDGSTGSVLSVILLLCAMSIHSLFEGLAVGLQSTVQSTVALFSAILLHKLIIAAGIGVNLATVTTNYSVVHGQLPPPQLTESSVLTLPANGTTLNRKVLLYQATSTFILASSSPLGVLIGWALMQQQQSGILEMTTATLQGLACGTFFYVVFCELLPDEFRAGVGDRIWKLLFLIFGFSLIVLYTVLVPH